MDVQVQVPFEFCLIDFLFKNVFSDFLSIIHSFIYLGEIKELEGGREKRVGSGQNQARERI